MVSAVVRVQTGEQDDKFVVTLPQWGRRAVPQQAGKANAEEEARWA
jgi:hypothetical protein